jgi:RNase adaptor protein for sRNA GlmZ degradation
MLDDICVFVATLQPSLVRNNRRYLTVVIGRTGGRRRSVYFVETLARAFCPTVQVVLARHRALSQRAE